MGGELIIKEERKVGISRSLLVDKNGKDLGTAANPIYVDAKLTALITPIVLPVITAIAGVSTEITQLLIKSVLDTIEANQLPDGHNVAVSNMIAAVETGLAKSANQLPAGHNVTPLEKVPTDSSRTNPSMALTWVAGNITQIQKVIGGVTYTKTLVWSAGLLQSMTAWS